MAISHILRCKPKMVMRLEIIEVGSRHLNAEKLQNELSFGEGSKNGSVRASKV